MFQNSTHSHLKLWIFRKSLLKHYLNVVSFVYTYKVTIVSLQKLFEIILNLVEYLRHLSFAHCVQRVLFLCWQKLPGDCQFSLHYFPTSLAFLKRVINIPTLFYKLLRKMERKKIFFAFYYIRSCVESINVPKGVLIFHLSIESNWPKIFVANIFSLFCALNSLFVG